MDDAMKARAAALEALETLIEEANCLGPQLPYNAPTKDLAAAIKRAREAHVLLTATPAALTDEETGKATARLEEFAAACDVAVRQFGPDHFKGRDPERDAVAIRSVLARLTTQEAEIARLTVRLEEVERERDKCFREWENAYREYKIERNLAQAAEAKLAALTVGDTADRVAEVIAEGDGLWRSCSGCLELEDGQNVHGYPWSKVLGCTLGGGCGECGGLGAIWDTTDYEEMGRELSAPTPDLVALKEAGLNAKLPDHYRWGPDAMEQFEFGKQRAVEAILAIPAIRNALGGGQS